MNITIEEMKLSHIAEIAEIERECFSSPWSENALKEELDNPNARFFVALDNGKTVGYIGVHSVLDENYIDNIAVAPKFRKKGIATALLAFLEAYVKTKNASFISLEVRKSNEEAIRLYERCSYKRVGERKRFYTLPTEDAIIMTKELEE